MSSSMYNLSFIYLFFCPLMSFLPLNDSLVEPLLAALLLLKDLRYLQLTPISSSEMTLLGPASQNRLRTTLGSKFPRLQLLLGDDNHDDQSVNDCSSFHLIIVLLRIDILSFFPAWHPAEYSPPFSLFWFLAFWAPSSFLFLALECCIFLFQDSLFFHFLSVRHFFRRFWTWMHAICCEGEKKNHRQQCFLRFQLSLAVLLPVVFLSFLFLLLLWRSPCYMTHVLILFFTSLVSFHWLFQLILAWVHVPDRRSHNSWKEERKR